MDTSWRRRAEYYAFPWRGKWATELGGALMTHAIHNHDLRCYVLGPVRRLFAYTTTRVNPIEVVNCVAIAAEMADGSAAALGVTLGSVDEISRLRFSFSGLAAESNGRPYTSSGDPWMFTGDSPEYQAWIDGETQLWLTPRWSAGRELEGISRSWTPLPMRGERGASRASFRATLGARLPGMQTRPIRPRRF